MAWPRCILTVTSLVPTRWRFACSTCRQSPLHHFTFSWRQGIIPAAQFGGLGPLFTRRTVRFERLMNCIEQILIPKRLGQENSPRPPSMARTDMGMSPCPVMKMIGIELPRTD